MMRTFFPLTEALVLLCVLFPVSTTSLHNTPDTRRNFIAQSVAGVVIANSALVPGAFAEDSSDGTPSEGVTVFKLKSGLQFIDLVQGSGPSPKYGQLCSIKYTAYLQLPSKLSERQKFDSDQYLLKHGNGRLISGLDEGLHTMKVGGQRRILIPPKLGFVADGLGPVPQSPFARLRLNQLLKEMVEQRGGKLIYDVELLRVLDDEADQGYYDDLSLTDEQFETLRDNIQNKARSNRGIPTVGES